MHGYEWAEGNIDAQTEFSVPTPRDLQDRGVDVYFAPNLQAGLKLVNLASGRVEEFWEEEERPDVGYYAGFDSLERFCRKHGLPLQELDGQAVMLPTGSGEAGDPLPQGDT